MRSFVPENCPQNGGQGLRSILENILMEPMFDPTVATLTKSSSNDVVNEAAPDVTQRWQRALIKAPDASRLLLSYVPNHAMKPGFTANLRKFADLFG